MADALSFIPTNVLHKLYKKRKNTALEHGRKKINVELKKEVEYFGDFVIVPYMDNYDLVVLKTVAICEYGARFLTAKYIIKCDDDTFVRVGAVIKEAKKVDGDRSLYVGNMDYYHKPLRNGKWAVTYEQQGSPAAAELEVRKLKLVCAQSIQMPQQQNKICDNVLEFCVNELLKGENAGGGSQN